MIKTCQLMRQIEKEEEFWVGYIIDQGTHSSFIYTICIYNREHCCSKLRCAFAFAKIAKISAPPLSINWSVLILFMLFFPSFAQEFSSIKIFRSMLYYVDGVLERERERVHVCFDLGFIKSFQQSWFSFLLSSLISG